MDFFWDRCTRETHWTWRGENIYTQKSEQKLKQQIKGEQCVHSKIRLRETAASCRWISSFLTREIDAYTVRFTHVLVWVFLSSVMSSPATKWTGQVQETQFSLHGERHSKQLQVHIKTCARSRFKSNIEVEGRGGTLSPITELLLRSSDWNVVCEYVWAQVSRLPC